MKLGVVAIAFFGESVAVPFCFSLAVILIPAQQPTLGRQLFARLYETGYRVSVWRHLDRASPLLTPLHRLAIIVPIVMKPSVRTNGTLRQFFKQVPTKLKPGMKYLSGDMTHVAEWILLPIIFCSPSERISFVSIPYSQLVPLETLFTQAYSWMFLISPEHDATVKAALRNLPLRADSNVYCVAYRPGDPFGNGSVHLGPKVLPTDRTVRRMQTIHPEVAGRTLVELSSPVDHQHRNVCWPAGISVGRTVQQLYRLQTRTKTIDVSVELLGRF